MSYLLKNPITVIVITLIAIFYYLSLDKSARKAATSSETVAQLQGEVSQMESEVSQLQRQLETVNHPVAQEKAVRNELLMQRPGEYVLQLPDLEVAEVTLKPAATPSPWQQWKEILF